MRFNKGSCALLMILTVFIMSACETDNAVTSSQAESMVSHVQSAAKYEQISPQEAKDLMDSQQNFVIVDARIEEEFAEGHIEGAILIPEYEIASRAERELMDKNQLILVYCRSGRRSKIASEALASLGYTNVKEFGGIIDWPYDTVK